MAGMLTQNYDTSKLWFWNPRFQHPTYTNGSGAPVTLPKGRLMGRITATQKVVPHVAAATDGSQEPIGVLGDEYVVGAGATVPVYLLDGGDVAEEKILFNASEGFSTSIATGSTGGTSIRDAIARNTDLKLVASTEMTAYDN